ATSWNVGPLPAGQTVYARIWTQTSAGFSSNMTSDISFTATARAATFIYPPNGQTNVDGTQAFQWTKAYAPAYKLTIGTTSGGSDVLSTGDLTTTSYTVSGSTLAGSTGSR